MRHVYDALATLASSMGSALAEPALVALFVPPLLAKWQALPADDREQLRLMECLTDVIPSLGVAGFQPFAAPVFQRCVAIAQQQLQNKQTQAAGGPEYEHEYLVRALCCVMPCPCRPR
jgi:transportin-1